MGREAIIELVVQGPAGERTVSAVVDTGFNGALTLPTRTVQELALVRRSSQRGTLADGSEAVLAVHLATVVWDGVPRRIRILATSITHAEMDAPELEATSGIEPLNRGFADPRLTTWPRRREWIF